MSSAEDFTYKEQGDRRITVSSGTILVLVKFKVAGNLRFLSHAETLRLFPRACVRAGIEVAYTQGYNPRPRLSLPLPRSVAVASDDELLCLWLRCRQQKDTAQSGTAPEQSCKPPFNTEEFKAALSAQLPKGFQLLTIDVAEAKPAIGPVEAAYNFVVQPEYLDDRLKARIERLMAADSLDLERRIDARGNIRNVDVRGFLKSVVLNDRGVTVECKITSAGSIRVNEILELLELDAGKLAEPVRRINVKWQQARSQKQN